MARNQVIGKAKVKIDGVLYETAGDTVLDPGGPSRTPVEGDYEEGAFQEGAPKPSKLEFSVLTKSSFSPSAFGRITGATASVEFDNGKSFVIRQAYSESRPPMGTSDGKAKCVLYGKAAEEVA
ncbi:MAG: phage tail tube protein [Sphingobium sp.]